MRGNNQSGPAIWKSPSSTSERRGVGVYGVQGIKLSGEASRRKLKSKIKPACKEEGDGKSKEAGPNAGTSKPTVGSGGKGAKRAAWL